MPGGQEEAAAAAAAAAAAVFEGAALSNFPNDQALYARVTCPVLILQASDDDAHPVAAAELLARLLPNAVLRVYEGRSLDPHWAAIGPVLAAFVSGCRKPS